MKKRLLFGALLMGSFLTANAQDDCAGAVAVTDGSTTNVTAVDGAYGAACFGGTNNAAGTAPLKAEWYSFTPTENGLLTISSALDSNPAGTTGTDTRVSIFTGTCDALECYNANDDVDGASADYRSEITIPVEADVTYYIAWDSFWQATTAFDFSVEFEASDCLSPNDLFVMGFSDVTLDSATFAWEAAIGEPGAYDVQVGEIGFTPGEGTNFETTTTSVSLTDLSSADNEGLDVYVRANCGDSQGEWAGPFRLLLVAELPYSNNFDNLDGRADGFTSTTWGISTNAEQGVDIAESGDGFIFTNTSTTAASDAWLFSRAIDVAAGEEVTVTFQAWVASAGAVETLLDITFGDSTDPEDHTVAESFEIESSDDYEEFTASWTATEAGTYFIGFHHNSEATDAAASLVIDTIEMTGGAAGTNDVLASKFTVYPNPANNVINIANAENILVNGVVITDLNGRTVKNVSYDGVAEAQINVSDLAAGMYMMTVSSDKGTMTKKIVKN